MTLSVRRSPAERRFRHTHLPSRLRRRSLSAVAADPLPCAGLPRPGLDLVDQSLCRCFGVPARPPFLRRPRSPWRRRRPPGRRQLVRPPAIATAGALLRQLHAVQRRAAAHPPAQAVRSGLRPRRRAPLGSAHRGAGGRTPRQLAGAPRARSAQGFRRTADDPGGRRAVRLSPRRYRATAALGPRSGRRARSRRQPRRCRADQPQRGRLQRLPATPGARLERWLFAPAVRCGAEHPRRRRDAGGRTGPRGPGSGLCHGVHGRLRNHHQHGRQRYAGAAHPSRPARPAAAVPGVGGERGGGTAALRWRGARRRALHPGGGGDRRPADSAWRRSG